MTQNSPISLKQISDSVQEKHKNTILSEVNESCLRLAVNEGIFDWHYHPNSDELFLVLEGSLTIEFQEQKSVEVRPGDIFIVPAKMIHRTIAKTRTVNLCFELTKNETVFLPDSGVMPWSAADLKPEDLPTRVLNPSNLENFIVKAKSNGWVALEPNGKNIPPSKIGSYDIIFDDGDFHYHDSFVGLSDFCGQECVTLSGEPIWSMAYQGYLLKPDEFTGEDAIRVLKPALGKMYREGRFLGGISSHIGEAEYRDINDGDYKRFSGTEQIWNKGKLVYELRYFGGLVRK